MKFFCGCDLLSAVKMNSFLCIDGQTEVVYTEQKQGDVLCLTANQNGVYDEIMIEKASTGFFLKRKIKNLSEKVINLEKLKLVFSGINFGGKSEDDYFYANENARIFNTLTVPVDYDYFDDANPQNKKFDLPVDRRWCDPGVVGGLVCSSPYQPFPAILLSNYNTKLGVIVGSLMQKVFYHSFNVYHNEDGVCLEVHSAFKGIKYREFEPNETLEDQMFIGKTDCADDINSLFDVYSCVLRDLLQDNHGKAQTNRRELLWDSWNDGIYRSVSEEMLLNEAKAVKKYFPTVKWFELDDGYTAYDSGDVDSGSHGLGCAYEGENAINKTKFPNGLDGYAQKIKDLGLKPALWVGAFCPVGTKIYRERPDWFIDYTYRVASSQPLDVSKSEVREYMQNAIDALIKKNGFEGIKHDFWTYAFEDRHDLLANKNKSGYEYREWWHKTIRESLPEGGYVEAACDISMGNPFLGKYFNNYRFGLDVGAGEWNKLKATMFFALAVLSTHTGDLYIPNSDSVGMLPGLNDRDFMFIVNFQLITRTLVEICGRFSKVNENDSRLKVLQKAVACINNGQDVYFANYDYRRKGANIPNVIYIKTPFFAVETNEALPLRTVALLNADDEQKTFSVEFSALGIDGGEYVVTDVWSGETKLVKGAYNVTLPAHGSVLINLNCTDGAQILDANVEIKNAKKVDGGIEFVIPYKAQAKIKINFGVKGVCCNGKAVDFAVSDNEITFSTEDESKITLSY